MVTPTEVAVRMYQVGFGDCFLLSFTYGPGDVRHLLIDFGQKSGVKRRDGGPAMGDKALIAVAEDIRGRVGDGLLAGIVVSHRHEDHLSAFGIPKVEEIISSLHPQVVLRPWTERPEAARDEGKPTRTEGRYLAGLAAATGMAEQLAVHRFAAERSVAGQALIGAARSELPNGPAIRALERIGDAATAEYLAARRPGEPEVSTAIADHLPGVTIDILGPPRPDAWPPIRGQREDDP